jgi:hypothetical protein
MTRISIRSPAMAVSKYGCRSSNKAFSSEVDAGSREENASNRELEPRF